MGFMWVFLWRLRRPFLGNVRGQKVHVYMTVDGGDVRLEEYIADSCDILEELLWFSVPEPRDAFEGSILK